MAYIHELSQVGLTSLGIAKFCQVPWPRCAPIRGNCWKNGAAPVSKLQRSQPRNAYQRVVKTSAIEDENLDTAEVRSSIARWLGIEVAGLPKPSRHVEGVVEMMVDATTNFAPELTEERLFEWHASLFPTGRNRMTPIAVGQWRPAEAGPMQVVSGPLGKERVHFQAPAAERLSTERADR